MSVDARQVRDWIALMRAAPESAEHQRLFPVYDEICVLVEERPDEAWHFILEVLASDASTLILETLSAGPLEDLLVQHGERMIARVEAQAQRDPCFARLLGGVWQNRMADELWRRVLQARDRRGWDGEPGVT